MKWILLLVGLLFISQAALAQEPVDPQPPRPDGSIIHVVQFGDTLEGILATYADYGVTMDDLIVYNNWRFRPQFIFVDDQIVILPPGSVDPNTGELVPGFERPAAAPTSAPAETTAPESTPVPTSTTPEASPVDSNLPSEPGVPAFQSIEPFLPVSVEVAAVPEIILEATEETTPELEAIEESVATQEVTAQATEISATGETATFATQEAVEPLLEVTESATDTPVPVEVANVPDFAATTGFICVRFFEDTNQNGRFESGEAYLPGGQATVNGESQTGVEDAACFAEVPPGEHTVETVAPEGYGLTTSPLLKAQVVAGRTTDVVAGAAADYEPPDTPVPVAETLEPPTLRASKNTSTDDAFRLSDYSAYLVLIVAAGVLIGGAAIIAALRSFR